MVRFGTLSRLLAGNPGAAPPAITRPSRFCCRSLATKIFFPLPTNPLAPPAIRSHSTRCTLTLEAHATEPTTRHRRGKRNKIHASSRWRIANFRASQAASHTPNQQTNQRPAKKRLRNTRIARCAIPTLASMDSPHALRKRRLPRYRTMLEEHASFEMADRVESAIRTGDRLPDRKTQRRPLRTATTCNVPPRTCKRSKPKSRKVS